MLDRQLYKFYISYRLDGEVHVEWVEGINLRHAKERIELRHPDASDLMDWTKEREEDLQKYLVKVDSEKKQKPGIRRLEEDEI